MKELTVFAVLVASAFVLGQAARRAWPAASPAATAVDHSRELAALRTEVADLTERLATQTAAAAEADELREQLAALQTGTQPALRRSPVNFVPALPPPGRRAIGRRFFGRR